MYRFNISSTIFSTAVLLLTLFSTEIHSANKNVSATDTMVTDTAAMCRHTTVRKTRSGIIIVGEGSVVRAFEPFCRDQDSGLEYAAAINRYKEALGGQVNVYCMVIPTAAEYYCPDEAKCWSKNELPVINGIYGNLSDSVVGINVHKVLSEHIFENIYSRTDHHWAPLGAYYAAQAFAGAAGVPFADLSSYENRSVKNYVGTMYLYSKDNSVLNAPEEFIYHIPQGVDYNATFIKYRLDRNRRINGESAPVKDNFFVHYGDGSSGAYCTFMGGDTRTVKVSTSTKNGRRLLIMKDSYGNALPGYLFHSFEEIHVIDFRYFTKHVVEYAKKNNITDMLFANNIFHACLGSTAEAYIKLM